jgi:hypothetical protein
MFRNGEGLIKAKKKWASEQGHSPGLLPWALPKIRRSTSHFHPASQGI